jgi:hypothetical protein
MRIFSIPNASLSNGPFPSKDIDDDFDDEAHGSHSSDNSLERRIFSTQTASLSNGPFPSKDIDEDLDDDVVLLHDDMIASVVSTCAPKLYQSWADINHEVSLMALRSNKQALHPFLPTLIPNNATYSFFFECVLSTYIASACGICLRLYFNMVL